MFICNNGQRSNKTNHSFECNRKCLIYYSQKHYVGDKFRNRRNTYKDNARKFDGGEHCMQRHLYEHFTLPGHSGFPHDVSITMRDKTDPTR